MSRSRSVDLAHCALVSLLVVCLTSVAASAWAKEKLAPVKTPVPKPLQSFVEALRAGKLLQARVEHRHNKLLSAWLKKELTVGKSTVSDVRKLLGPKLSSLDRPRRDGLVSKQYQLGGLNVWANSLVFHFDAKTGALKSWGLSHAICGFCPHVYSWDGAWRLEGKGLAGRIGRSRAGTDVLVLPRLTPENGFLSVKLANIAPEVEYLDQVRLGIVQLSPNEELDVTHESRAIVYTVRQQLTAHDLEQFQFDAETDALVFEAMNTTAMETRFRHVVLGAGFDHSAALPDTAMEIRTNEGEAIRISPVGSKFLRRIVVPLRDSANGVSIANSSWMWWQVNRIWAVETRSVQDKVHWCSAATASRVNAKSLVKEQDGRCLVLAPDDSTVLRFKMPVLPSTDSRGRCGYVLQLHGHYTILSRPHMVGSDSATR